MTESISSGVCFCYFLFCKTAIICFDLIPEAFELSNLFVSMIGIIIGIILMIICDLFISNKVNKSSKSNISLAANTGTINVDVANLRETADANSKILEQIPSKQEVEIMGEQGDWYNVSYKNMTGYISKELVTVNSDSKTTEEKNNVNENSTNEKQQKRYSALDERIRELSETTGDNNTDGEE